MSGGAEKVDFRRDEETRHLAPYRGGEFVGTANCMGDVPSSGNLERVRSIVKDIYRAVSELEGLYPGRRFTPDSHMVGSLGEVVAAERYCLNLIEPSHPVYDAYDHGGRLVQIKTTQGNKVGISEKLEDRIDESGY